MSRRLRLPLFLIALLALPRLSGTVERMALASPLLGLGPEPLSQRNVHRLARAMSLVGLGTRYLGGGPVPRFNARFETNRPTSDPVRFARTVARRRKVQHDRGAAPDRTELARLARLLQVINA